MPRSLRRLGVSIGENVRFYGMPFVSLEGKSRIEIGDNSVICSNSSMTDLGVDHPIVLRTLRAGANIKIGRNTGVSGGSICAAVRVDIGNECLLGANVIITDTDFHALNPKGRRFNSNPQKISAAPVVIEDNVFIGTRSIILKGVRIGRNSVIGAGSVVTKNIPENSIAAGNPAKVLRRI